MDEQVLVEKKPIDYLKMVCRRKWFLIVPMVIGITGGIIAANVLPKIYRASTLILVEEGKVINPLIEGLAVSTSTAQRLAVLREQILGWDRLNQLISAVNLAKDVRSQIEFEELVKRLRKDIQVKLYDRNIIGISYEDKKPGQSQAVVKTITDIFIAENLRQQNKETETAINFINDQLALFQKKLKQSEIAQLEDQLNKLLVDSTEKHPMVVELKAKISAAKEELNKGDYTINGAPVTDQEKEINALKEDLGKMRQELATSSLDASQGGANRTQAASAVNEKLYKLLLMEKIDDVAARDATVNQKLYNELLERLETAKLTQSFEASKEGTRYTILDPARLPLKPVKPNKVLVLLFGLFVGACAGCGLIFLVEMLDQSFLSVEEAKYFINLPIFGAIAKIITQADLKAQKLRRLRITGFSVVGGIVLLVVIIFNVLLSS
jgi:uncharacterized protein involved in exopolysaccharide biosynthesis